MKKFSKIQKIVSPNKIKFNFCIVLIFLLFSISFVLASDFDYEEPTITIKISNTSVIPNLSSSITINVEVINKQFDKSIQNITFTIINGTKIKKDTDIEFFFITNGSQVDYNIVTCLTEKSDCLIDKASFNTAWTKCVLDLNEYEGENSTTNKEALDVCTLRNQEKDLLIGNKDTQILDLEEEKKDTENVRFFWGIGGALLMLFGCLFYFGKIGKGFVKDKSESEFNKGQAG